MKAVGSSRVLPAVPAAWAATLWSSMHLHFLENGPGKLGRCLLALPHSREHFGWAQTLSRAALFTVHADNLADPAVVLHECLDEVARNPRGARAAAFLAAVVEQYVALSHPANRDLHDPAMLLDNYSLADQWKVRWKASVYKKDNMICIDAPLARLFRLLVASVVSPDELEFAGYDLEGLLVYRGSLRAEQLLARLKSHGVTSDLIHEVLNPRKLVADVLAEITADAESQNAPPLAGHEEAERPNLSGVWADVADITLAPRRRSGCMHLCNSLGDIIEACWRWSPRLTEDAVDAAAINRAEKEVVNIDVWESPSRRSDGSLVTGISTTAPAVLIRLLRHAGVTADPIGVAELPGKPALILKLRDLGAAHVAPLVPLLMRAETFSPMAFCYLRQTIGSVADVPSAPEPSPTGPEDLLSAVRKSLCALSPLNCILPRPNSRLVAEMLVTAADPDVWLSSPGLIQNVEYEACMPCVSLMLAYGEPKADLIRQVRLLMALQNLANDRPPVLLHRAPAPARGSLVSVQPGPESIKLEFQFPNSQHWCPDYPLQLTNWLLEQLSDVHLWDVESVNEVLWEAVDCVRRLRPQRLLSRACDSLEKNELGVTRRPLSFTNRITFFSALWDGATRKRSSALLELLRTHACTYDDVPVIARLLMQLLAADCGPN